MVTKKEGSVIESVRPDSSLTPGKAYSDGPTRPGKGSKSKLQDGKPVDDRSREPRTAMDP